MSAHTPPRSARITGRAAAVLAALLLALSAVMFASGPAVATGHSVTIKQYAYGPGSLSIKQGDTVTWTNQDTAAHDVKVTSGPVSFQSPLLDQGESWSYTFATAGSYSYICSVHPDMKGSVTAVAKAPAPAPTTSAPTHVHSEAPAPSATHTHAATSHASEPAKAAEKKKATKASATPTAAPAATELTTANQQTTTTLNPLLLVAGASIAVVVFCLLLMTARPRVHTSKSAPSGDEA